MTPTDINAWRNPSFVTIVPETDAIRVRLYRGAELEADTDPDAADDASGAEVVEDLAAGQRALVELCEALHAGQLLGFSPMAMAAYLAMQRDRAAHGRPFSYTQGYTVLLDTPERRSATDWRARVDIAVSP